MKTIIIVTLSIIPLTAIASIVEEYKWDNEAHRLEYRLKEDTVVTIRAGSPNGPLYQTIVNQEKRPKGLNIEKWDGKDSETGIDFNKYAPFHFYIDTQPREMQDFRLQISIKNSPVLINPKTISITKNDPINLTMDVPETKIKDISGMELKVFIDNILINQVIPDKYPFLFRLNPGNISPGQHLLTINYFEKMHAGVCGYTSIMLDIAINPESPKLPILAYSVYMDGFWQVGILDINTSITRLLTNTPVDKLHPTWSKDGKRLAYVTNTGELWIMDIEGNTLEKVSLPMHYSEPAWSKDGKILFTTYTDLSHCNTEIWMIDIKTNELTKLTNRPWLQYQPSWSPDGKNIIFVDGPELYGQEIRKLNIKTRHTTQLTENGPNHYDLYPRYHPDGKRIYYSSNQLGNNYDIWVMDGYGRNPTNLTNHPAHDTMPIPTQDGIYFLSDRGGSSQAWKMDTHGENPNQITNIKHEIHDISIHIPK